MESSELSILLNPLQLAVIICRLPLSERVELNHFPQSPVWVVGQLVDLFCLNKQFLQVCKCPLSHNHTLGFYWFEQHRRLWHIFIKSHDDPSVLYVGDCDVVNKPPVEWQTDFSFSLLPLFAALIIMLKPWQTVWQRWSIPVAIPVWSGRLWICCLRTSNGCNWSNS